MLSAANSLASVFESAETDERMTLDKARLGIGSLTADDVETTMAPPPRCFIEGAQSRTMRTALRTSNSNAPCHAASSNESTVPAGGPPALTKSRSTPPLLATVASNHAWMEAADFTSSTCGCACPPVSVAIRAAAALIESSFRELIETTAPSAARPFATAYPSPRLAPATIATFPFKPRSMMPLLETPSRSTPDRAPLECPHRAPAQAGGSPHQPARHGVEVLPCE